MAAVDEHIGDGHKPLTSVRQWRSERGIWRRLGDGLGGSGLDGSGVIISVRLR